MIILKIPRKVDDKDLREFILNQIKKFRRNQKRKYIKLEGELAYSNSYVYFLFPSRGLELAFALSIYFKCEKHRIPCELRLSKPIPMGELPAEIVEAAKVWSERKLHRKHYKLKNLRL
ncbi:MAG: hypothetical protein J7J99_03870 [Thermoprotei archaeon]|nr:hypothetical protein [Thermoprotei archaeon]